MKQSDLEVFLEIENSKIEYYIGYYCLDIASGAFLTIDSNEQYTLLHDSINSSKMVNTIVTNTVSISLDGKNVKSFLFGEDVQFDGKTLVIEKENLSVDLVRNFQDGKLIELSGIINGTSVKGYTYFNPVPLNVFLGDYKETITPFKPVLSISKDLFLHIDLGNNALTTINSFSYNSAMYVVTFSAEEKEYILMLGTAGKMGLACSIGVNGKSNFVVTIPTNY